MKPFLMGFLWMLMISIQTRLIASGKNIGFLLVWAFLISLIWGYLIKMIVLDANTILPYAIGTSFGVTTGVIISKRYD